MGESVVGYEGSFYRVALDAGEVGDLLDDHSEWLQLPVVWAATGDGEPEESLVRSEAITSVRPS